MNRHLRWKISLHPHADGTDRRKPRDAGVSDARKMLKKEPAMALFISEIILCIQSNIANFPAKPKGNKGHGEIYEVIMTLKGVNGKEAKVLTGWIDDANTGEMRLITAHIDD
jgi:hypothetical protein